MLLLDIRGRDMKNKKQEENPFVEDNKENLFAGEVPEENNAEETEKTPEVSEVEDLKKKLEVLNQQYVRLAADFDNYRKRQAQERESLLKYGSETALKKMIEVLDNFERGEKALEKVEECQTVKDSFNLIHKQVFETLEKLGLETIETEGKEFDPNFHEAVMQTPNSDVPEHTILNELQKGYKLGEKVLRPALVNVAT